MLEILRRLAEAEQGVGIRTLGGETYAHQGTVRIVNDEMVAVESRSYVAYLAIAHISSIETERAK